MTRKTLPHLLCGLVLLAWAPGTYNTLAQLPQTKPAVLATDKPSGGEISPDDAQAPAAPVQSLETKVAEARANLAEAEAAGAAAATNAPAGVSLEDVATRRALLHRLVLVYEQQKSNVAELEETKSRRAQLAREANAWRGFTEPPPYSILLPDRLRQEIQAEQLKSAGGQNTISMIDQLIAENQAALTRAEEEIRQLDEQLEAADDPAIKARLSRQRELEHLRSQAAAGSVGVCNSERLLRQESLAESQTRLEWLERQLVIADANARFTKADLDKIMVRIERGRQALERELTEAQARSNAAQQALETAREGLRRTLVSLGRHGPGQGRAGDARGAVRNGTGDDPPPAHDAGHRKR